VFKEGCIVVIVKITYTL